MSETEKRLAIIPDDCRKQRLDQVLVRLFPDYSRSQLQRWIKDRAISVNEQFLRAKDKVQGGERICLLAKMQQQTQDQAENISLDVVYEDDSLLVINKPAGLVVHPGAGNWQGTLVNALLWHYPEQQALARAGIVHRLDKNTTGLMVVARSLQAHKHLVEQLQARKVKREYLALVQGEVISGGRIEGNIARHRRDRKCMTVVPFGGKTAVTHYRIETRFQAYTLLRVRLETGRTHQIRVHMANKRLPIVGDHVYGGRLRLVSGSSDQLKKAIKQFRRQALHATQLGLQHPKKNRYCEWQVAPPEDMQALLQFLVAKQ